MCIVSNLSDAHCLGKHRVSQVRDNQCSRVCYSHHITRLKKKKKEIAQVLFCNQNYAVLTYIFQFMNAQFCNLTFFWVNYYFHLTVSFATKVLS